MDKQKGEGHQKMDFNKELVGGVGYRKKIWKLQRIGEREGVGQS